ncbi:hypothetical protein FGG08_000194 [Glutinoglossum americanum]|uniref:Heterokaryon incompatibility domain-containing protein n=1 Tax=Glutinoglossum americanum TaxID=1670608 RepID=A0A9P8IFY5_9PEZI|nr:hypothetical protein FGG08_000194 [Glutinoglossum americanum]
MPSPPLHQLCEVCSKIRFDAKTINPDHLIGDTNKVNHHRSLIFLANSAESCHLCAILLAAIRLRIDPSGVDHNWLATTSHATNEIQLAYRRHKDKDYPELQVNYGGGTYAVLKIAVGPQSRYCSSRRVTVHADVDAERVLDRIPPKPLPENYKFHYSAVANCRAESVELDSEDVPDQSVWEGFFVHEAGWVCNVYAESGACCLVAWSRTKTTDNLAWVPAENLTRLYKSPHIDCSCGRGVWEQPLIAAGQTEYLAEDPASDEIITQIKLWNYRCHNYHDDCPAGHDVELPDRVIDVGPPDGSQEPSLSIGKGRRGAYVTLSYRWGLVNTLMTAKASMESHINGIPHCSLPKTIRDAVTVTRKLGFRYLWIDALCIIQDCQRDWLSQSAKMGQIYGDAVLNIQADCAANSNDGFLKKRPLREIRSCEHPDLLGDGVRMAVCPNHQYPTRAMKNGFLSSRGWILQERALSKRIVHWTTHEVFWECWSSQATERRPAHHQWTAGIPLSELLPGDTIEGSFRAGWGMERSTYDGVRIAVNKNTAKTITPAQPPGYKEPEVDYRSWYDLVKDYSDRDLTLPDDKLIAVSSLAATFQKQNNLQGAYLAGLWSDDIVSGLIWKRGDYFQRMGHPSKLKGLVKYRAPSFSWASVEGKVEFPDDTWMDVIYNELDPQLFDCSISAELEDPFSSVNGGHIGLQGYTMRYLNMPSEQKRRMIPKPDDIESYAVMDQSEDPSFEDERAPSWTPNILALFLRARRRTPEEKNEGESGKTSTEETKNKPKESFESYWLLLYPSEQGDIYFRAGLHIEKEDIQSIQPILEERALTIIQQQLAEPRPSLSPSQFSEGAFNDFRKKANRAVNKADVMAKAFLIPEGNSDVPSGIKRTFTNLAALTDGAIVDVQPDSYYGARPDQLDPRVQEDLNSYIIPSANDRVPILPNNFTEGKGPGGTFSFTDTQLPNNPFFMPHGLLGSDILQPLQTKAQSATNIAATAVPGAISSAATTVPGATSKAESAAKAAATAIPNTDTIEDLTPRNFSLGTKQFRIGFSNHTECKNLPLKIPSAIPEAAAKILGEQLEELRPEQILTGIITPIRYCLIRGLMWIVIIAIILTITFASSMFSRRFCFGEVLGRLFCFGGLLARFVICLASGLLCLVFFLILAAILHVVLERANYRLPPSIEIHRGEVGRYCWGTVGCATIAMVLAAALLFFARLLASNQIVQ